MMKKKSSWKEHSIEFLAVFIAVISAFGLNNWNDNRRDSISENKILTEIANGLEKDLGDLRLNIRGHKQGLAACTYFRNAFANKKVNSDSAAIYFLNLTRDFVSIQNVAGYETLKSKGLELVKNDSLRLEIISLYEYDYNTLKKLEEEYAEMQFQASYFKEFNAALAPNFELDSNNLVVGINLPLKIQENKKKELALYLWKIETNRNFIMQYYGEVEKKIHQLRADINKEINQ